MASDQKHQCLENIIRVCRSSCWEGMTQTLNIAHRINLKKVAMRSTLRCKHYHSHLPGPGTVLPLRAGFFKLELGSRLQKYCNSCTVFFVQWIRSYGWVTWVVKAIYIFDCRRFNSFHFAILRHSGTQAEPSPGPSTLVYWRTLALLYSCALYTFLSLEFRQWRSCAVTQLFAFPQILNLL